MIFIHGGLFYCSGNDLKILASGQSMDEAEKIDTVSAGVEHYMVVTLLAIH